MKIKQLIANFLKEEDGLTTVEYAVAGGIVSTTITGAFDELAKEVEVALGVIGDRLLNPNTP